MPKRLVVGVLDICQLVNLCNIAAAALVCITVTWEPPNTPSEQGTTTVELNPDIMPTVWCGVIHCIICFIELLATAWRRLFELHRKRQQPPQPPPSRRRAPSFDGGVVTAQFPFGQIPKPHAW